MQGNVNTPICFNVFLDSICKYVQSKFADLGSQLHYNIDGHLTGRRKPNGSQPCWILSCADDMVIFKKNCEQLQAVLAVVQAAE